MKKEEYMWDYRNPYEWMERTMQAKFPPMMITCALTGGRTGKASTTEPSRDGENRPTRVYEAIRPGRSP